MKYWLISLFLLSIALPAIAEKKALIFTISEYPQYIGPLHGVRLDADNAKQMANSLGVNDSNIVIYKDAQLDLKGMRNALKQFSAGVNDGDQVFFYYSGHGGQKVMQDSNRCAVGLVSIDGKILFDQELQQFYQNIEKKTSLMVTFIDACFSGGVFNKIATRSIEQFTPKFWSKASPQQSYASCEKPINVITRSIDENQPDSGAINHVYITAARENEISFDEASSGGMATVAWKKCLALAPDYDQSGSISISELQQCAQQKLDERFAGQTHLKPSTITVRGKSKSAFLLNNEPALRPATASASQATPIPNLQATLDDLFQNRDERRNVVVKANHSSPWTIGETIHLNISSSHAGYVYVLMVGSDNKTFDMLYPNQLAVDNFINKTNAISLPSKGWKIKLAEPIGHNRLLTIISDTPRDFSALNYQKMGPFSAFNGAENGQYNLNKVISNIAPNKKCKANCNSAYGAALLDIVAE